MKIKLVKIISFVICLISLLSIAGCNTQKDTGKQDDGTYENSGLEITVMDANNKVLYNHLSPHTEILSLDEEYYLTVHVSIGAAFIPYSGVNVKYDEEYIEVSPLPEPYEGEVYSLRGLKECTNCLIEFYSVKYYLDSDGNMTTDGEISRYCSIVVNFS